MGGIYSTPQNNPQYTKPREVGPSNAHSALENLPVHAADTLSRLQGAVQNNSASSHNVPRVTSSTDHLFNSNLVLGHRGSDAPVGTGSLTPEEMLAATQLCSQLSLSQINALAAAYHQHQLQQQHTSVIQRPSSVSAGQLATFSQTLASMAKLSSSPPPSHSYAAFALGPPPGSSSSNTGGAVHQSRTTTAGLHTMQKRTSSSSVTPQQHQSGYTGSNKLPIASPQSNQRRIQPGFGSASHNTVGGVTVSQHSGSGSMTLSHHPSLPPLGAISSFSQPPPPPSYVDQLPVSRGQQQHHSIAPSAVPLSLSSGSPAVTTVASTALTYQGRRSQVPQPSSTTCSNKRPRISGGITHQTHHNATLPGLSIGGHVGVPTTAMEALMNSAVANKAIASLASGYASVSEAAAALSPLFCAAINKGALAGVSGAGAPISTTPASVGTPQPNNSLFSPHISALPPMHQHHRGSTIMSTTTNNAATLHHIHHHSQQQQQQQQQQQRLLSTSSVVTGGSGTVPSNFPTGLLSPPGSSMIANPPPNVGGPARIGVYAPPAQQLQPSVPVTATGDTSCQQSQVVCSGHIPGAAQSSHLSGKGNLTSQQPPLPLVSRLPSGHLHHPSVVHPLQTQGFHHSSQLSTVSQPGTSHHLFGHANIPQGSGVLRQQTKEPAYHPQVEAISPAPEESRLTDAQDAKINQEREELGRQLALVDADITKQEAHLRNLTERENRLRAQLTAGPNQPLDVAGGSMPSHRRSDRAMLGDQGLQRSYENPIQSFIAENRQRTRQHHMIFTRLCGGQVKASPFAVPLYRQPADLTVLRALRDDFRYRFRGKLIQYLLRRRRAEQSRIKFLAQQYARYSKVFTKKMDKLLSSNKRRQRDLRHRDIFERVFPEVKKNREDRELGSTEPEGTDGNGDPNCIQSSNIVDGSQPTPYDPFEEMNRLKDYAIDPPLSLAPWQRRYQFICQAGLVSDCRAELTAELDISRWSEEEKQIFRERYLATPKNFTSIASYLDRKTVAECIHYYYLSKKKEGYKQQLKKSTARRRRPAERGGGSGGASGSSSGGHNSSGGSTISTTSSSSSSAGCSSTAGGLISSSTVATASDSVMPVTSDTAATPSESVDGGSSSMESETTLKPGGKKEPFSAGSSSTIRTRPSRGRQAPTSEMCSSGTTSTTLRSRINFKPETNLDFTTPSPTSLNSQVGDVLAAGETPVISLKVTKQHTTIVGEEVFHETDGNIQKPLTGTSKAELTGGVDVSLPTPTTRTTSEETVRPSTSSSVGSISDASKDTSVGSGVGGPPSIKDLIHSAIEKNLAQPWPNGTVTSRLGLTVAQTAPATVTGAKQTLATNHLSSHLHSSTLDAHPSGGSVHLSSFRKNCGESVYVHREGPSMPSSGDKHDAASVSIPSETSSYPLSSGADIYAALARIAAAYVDSGRTVSDDVTVYCAAAAAAAACSLGGPGDDNWHSSSKPADPSGLGSSQSPSLTNYAVGTSSYHGASSAVSGALSRDFHKFSATRAPPQLHPSKAILHGDFLTAQQLGRTESVPAITTPYSILTQTCSATTNGRNANYVGSIDPSTLPVPMAVTAKSQPPTDKVAAADGILRKPTPSEDSLGTSLSAEHAAWLAIQAAHAAEASASVADGMVKPHSPSLASALCSANKSSDTVGDLPNTSLAHPPLSPSHPKNCMPHTVASNSMTHPSITLTTNVCRSAAYPESHSEVLQFTSSTNETQRRYGSGARGTDCDLSDSIRQLTNNETTQLATALKQVRRRNNHMILHHRVEHSQQRSRSTEYSNETSPDAIDGQPKRAASMSHDSTSEIIENQLHYGGPESQTSCTMDTEDAVPPQLLDRSQSQTLDGPRVSTACDGQLVFLKGDGIQSTPSDFIDALIHNNLTKSNVASHLVSTPEFNHMERNRISAVKQQAQQTSQVSVTSCGTVSTGAKQERTVDGNSVNGPPPYSPASTGNRYTLEEQINKAIADEIHAQLCPRTSMSSSTNKQSHQVHESTSVVSTKGTPQQNQNPVSSVPLKKRDRSFSNTVKPPFKISENASCIRESSVRDHSETGNQTPSSTSTASSSHSRVTRTNGLRPHFNLISNSAIWPGISKSLDASTIATTVESITNRASSLATTAEKKNLNDVDSSLALDSVQLPSATAASITSDELDCEPLQCQSPLTSCSGDLESPGKLQIDLAAPDYSPTPKSIDQTVALSASEFSTLQGAGVKAHRRPSELTVGYPQSILDVSGGSNIVTATSGTPIPIPGSSLVIGKAEEFVQKKIISQQPSNPTTSPLHRAKTPTLSFTVNKAIS